MIELIYLPAFTDWFEALRDVTARKLIARRPDRLSFGHEGDAEAVGDGVRELRIHFGPGYRVYFVRRGQTVIVVLGGGQNRTQRGDIAAAMSAAAALDES